MRLGSANDRLSNPSRGRRLNNRLNLNRRRLYWLDNGGRADDI